MLPGGQVGRREIDRRMSGARKALDWELQEKLGIDPSKFQIVKRDLARKRGKQDKTCSMCGEFCAMEVSQELDGGPI